jgi:hypothetical protein
MSSKNQAPNIAYSIVKNKYPYCRIGNMFVEKNAYKLPATLKMHKHCPICHGDLEPEVGFYFGTGYVSYGLSMIVCIVWLVIYSLLFEISFKDNSMFVYLATAVGWLLILQPLLMRISRSIWIAMFVKYRGLPSV